MPGAEAPPWSEQGNALLKALKKKGFREERVTTMRVDDLGISAILEANKNLSVYKTCPPSWQS
jgi:hypothetical protein